ncbi:SusC/RagA family TonB-linked outer membrane protein [Larkinella sp. VNQ87]|uniref:SusC/RagA family TonB-linked outer membrane protein n=1 Tax=Larkinella sp. VNQ87 TaxID=3400921 RepID=UPI003C0A6795
MHYRLLLRGILLLGGLLSVTSIQAQTPKPATINATVSGVVRDARNRDPLVGATVVIKGTTNGAFTDAQGRFLLRTGQQLPFTLVISFIGYRTVEIIATESTVDVSLQEGGSTLDEVVVVGYGTQKRSDLTGSIASVPTEIKRQPVASAERLLQGSVAGAIVTQTSGQPGGGVSVQIRGNNSITAGSDPLYVIDGFPINNDYSLNDAGVTSGAKINPLSTLNTADIESIDVLKDASATAIYGSRGANGVIIITTKRGSKERSTINYESFYGVQQVIRTIPVLNAREWWELRKDAARNSGRTPTLPSVTGYTLDTVGQGTDWQAAAFRKAPMQSHSLSLQAGSERTRVGISTNYFSQDGILHGTDFKRYTAGLNIDHEHGNRLRLSASITASRITSNVAPAGLVSNLLLAPPSLPIYLNDGSFLVNSPFETSLQNPINSLYNQTNDTKTNRVLGNLSADYQLLDGLRLKVLVGADLVDNRQNRYLPSTTGEGLQLQGLATVGSTTTTNWLNENTLTYDRVFGKHKLNAVTGFTAQQSETKTAVAEAAGFATDAFTYNNLGTGITNRNPRSQAETWALASVLGRINYVYDSRYLLTLTLRADGSSRFGDGNKWGYFPSAALGWNVANEPFFSSVRSITNLKARLSAGLTGNQSIPTYQSLSQLGYFRYNFSGNTVSGFAPTTVPNPNLSWERTFQVDFGLDFGLLNNRVQVVTDYYYKKTTDLLLTRTVPGTSGLADASAGQLASIYQNIGSVSNQGVELSVNSRNLTGVLRWNTIAIFSANRNKILSLGDGVTQIIPSISAPSIARVGYPVGSFIVYQTDGLIQQGDKALTPQANRNPGGQKYKDIDGDGQITQAGDRVVIANQPGLNLGLTNTLDYRGFDLTVFFQGTFGGKIYNANRANLELGSGYVNGSRDLLNRWTPTNTNTDVKAAYQDPAITQADRFIEDGSYVRLKNISLGYTLPRQWLQKAGIKTLRVYVSAQNAYTWTRYTGFDPEVSLNGQSLINRGVDSGVYPNNSSYQAGVSLSL